MGLIKAGVGALGGTLADQWKEFFYCEALSNDVIMTKGEKRIGNRSSNKKGTVGFTMCSGIGRSSPRTISSLDAGAEWSEGIDPDLFLRMPRGVSVIYQSCVRG